MKKIHPLKLEMIRQGVSQADLAPAAHMSASRLNRILNGRSRAQEYELKNLARVLGVNTEEVMP